MSDESHNLEPGSKFGKHLIMRKLGQGGMGEVYEVEHELTGIRHALKLLGEEVMEVPGALERFEREAKVMARLKHPGIVSVDDLGDTDGRHWLRMELMPGREVKGKRVITLEQYMQAKGGCLPEDEVQSLFADILDALAYAHETGLIHRDLKPANILFSGETQKISDFGLVDAAGGAEWLDMQVRRSMIAPMVEDFQSGESSLDSMALRSRALIGTYAYMSPEQKSCRQADPRSDLFAVGLMIREAITGEKSLGMEKPSEMVSGIRSEWDDFVRKAVANDMDRRFQTAREMAEDLKLGLPTRAQTGESEAKERSSADSSPDKSFDTQESETEGEMPNEGFAFFEPSSGNKMLWCQPGSFLMGSPWDEEGRGFDEIQHEVSFSTGFWLCEYPVSQKQWEQLMDSCPSLYKGDSLPLDTVSWDEAVEFCRKLTERERKSGNLSSRMQYCLPTEAQWEYACRAGTKTPFAFGRELTKDQANIDGERTTPVDSFKPNPWGFSDMHGNVYEWCSDWYGKYPTNPVSDPTGPKEGQARVRRGGHWGYGANGARSAFRRKLSPDQQIPGYLGFRVSLQML